MYRVLMADIPISEDQLNELVTQGMQLITIIYFNGKFYFYFLQP